MYRSVSDASAGSMPNAFRIRSLAAITSGGLSSANESLTSFLIPASSRILGSTFAFGLRPRMATTWSSIVA